GHGHRRRDSETHSRSPRSPGRDGAGGDSRPRRGRKLSANRPPQGRQDLRGRPPMILLRLISWPYARKHLARCLLTAAGIVLGVGVFVGMRTANKSVLAAFNQTIDRIAGA